MPLTINGDLPFLLWLETARLKLTEPRTLREKESESLANKPASVVKPRAVNSSCPRMRCKIVRHNERRRVGGGEKSFEVVSKPRPKFRSFKEDLYQYYFPNFHTSIPGGETFWDIDSWPLDTRETKRIRQSLLYNSSTSLMKNRSCTLTSFQPWTSS